MAYNKTTQTMRSRTLGSTSFFINSTLPTSSGIFNNYRRSQKIKTCEWDKITRHHSNKQYPISLGYVTDTEFSDCEDNEPQEARRTRSSSRRANNQASNSSNNTSASSPQNTSNLSTSSQTSSTENRGRKRKTRRSGDDGSEIEDNTDGGDKSRLKLDENQAQNNMETEEIACSCPKNVMRCIGILPSLPIASYFQTEDSDSSLTDDLNHFTVLPLSERPRKGDQEDC